MIILDGKRLSKKILKSLKKEIVTQNLKLKLGVVQVGKNKISDIYIAKKREACEQLGIEFELWRFPARITTEELAAKVGVISQKQDISGAIIQLPLPKSVNTQAVLNAVPLKKDVDCLSDAALARLRSKTSLILPPVVGAVSWLLKEYKISLKGKNIVLVGRGRLVGKPLEIWLTSQGFAVSVLNRSTPSIAAFTKKADTLISGVGKASLITGSMVKRGAIVFDVGSSVKNRKAVGDIDFKTVSKKAGYLTPVPGGIGPLTVICLLENLVKLKRK